MIILASHRRKLRRSSLLRDTVVPEARQGQKTGTSARILWSPGMTSRFDWCIGPLGFGITQPTCKQRMANPLRPATG
jgi:hypothetical protein